MTICSDDQGVSVVIAKLAGLMGCCIGAAEYGPHRCTCWTPVYDDANHGPQREPQTSIGVLVAALMCSDCAYRPDSPERRGDERAACSEPGRLDDIALGSRFWCHRGGMRKIVAWRHETLGITVEADLDAYAPPIIDGVPYLADGTPAYLCAGWAARKRQLEAASNE